MANIEQQEPIESSQKSSGNIQGNLFSELYEADENKRSPNGNRVQLILTNR